MVSYIRVQKTTCRQKGRFGDLVWILSWCGRRSPNCRDSPASELEAQRGKGRWGRNSTVKTDFLLRKLNGPPNGVAPNPRALKPLSNGFLSIAARNSSFFSKFPLTDHSFSYSELLFTCFPCISPELTNSCSLMAGLHLHPLRILYVLPMAACSRLCKSFKIRSNLPCWVFFSFLFFVCVKISNFIVLEFNIGTRIQEYHPLYTEVWEKSCYWSCPEAGGTNSADFP